MKPCKKCGNIGKPPFRKGGKLCCGWCGTVYKNDKTVKPKLKEGV